jgi:histidine ammonia-lyase
LPSRHLIGADPLTLGQVVALAEGAEPIFLAPQAKERVQRARAVVDRHAAGDAPVYGLNTALGGNLGYRLGPDEVASFQVQLIRARCIGVGEPLPVPVCRAALLCRIAGLAQGGAGISPDVLDLLVAMFNAGITPVVPGRGSIGAGDLGLCAHLAAACISLGEAWLGGTRVTGAQALHAAGLAPARLGPKDGLALINANAVSCGHAVFVLAELAGLLVLAAATAALAMQGYQANPRIFDPDLSRARPATGQARAAAWFARLLKESSLHMTGHARSIQDALSFRVAAPVFGTVLGAFETAVQAVETDINAAADNPLVLPDRDEILSTANFHSPSVALAFDTMAIALAHLATASAYRVTKLMTPQLSGLPRYLSPVAGASAGFNPLQKTAAALHGEIRLRATPASLDALPVSDGVEDHAPQTPLTIRKLAEQLVPLRLLVAIEAMVAAQAVDLREGASVSPATRILYDAVRADVPMLTDDRETGPDAMKVAARLGDAGLLAALRASLEGLDLPALILRR